MSGDQGNSNASNKKCGCKNEVIDYNYLPKGLCKCSSCEDNRKYITATKLVLKSHDIAVFNQLGGHVHCGRPLWYGFYNNSEWKLICTRCNFAEILKSVDSLPKSYGKIIYKWDEQ